LASTKSRRQQNLGVDKILPSTKPRLWQKISVYKRLVLTKSLYVLARQSPQWLAPPWPRWYSLVMAKLR
jgi:hypothetical protein